MANNKNDISSPCIKVCRLAPNTGICVGCFRTIQEISAWGHLTQEERKNILVRLEERKGHEKTQQS